MEQIPAWAWTVAGGCIVLLLGTIKVLITRELHRHDSVHVLVSDHVRKEEAVWVEIRQMIQLTKDLDARVENIESLTNGNVTRLAGAIDTMTNTLKDVLERRSEPRV